MIDETSEGAMQEVTLDGVTETWFWIDGKWLKATQSEEVLRTVLCSACHQVMGCPNWLPIFECYGFPGRARSSG